MYGLASSGKYYTTFSRFCATGRYTYMKKYNGYIEVTNVDININDYVIDSIQLSPQMTSDYNVANQAMEYVQNNKREVFEQMKNGIENGFRTNHITVLNNNLGIFLYDVLLPN